MFRVGIAYAVVAWLVAQVMDLVLDNFGAPAWFMRSLLVVLAAGLPLALVFAWAFELTPEGIKRTDEDTPQGRASAAPAAATAPQPEAVAPAAPKPAPRADDVVT